MSIRGHAVFNMSFFFLGFILHVGEGLLLKTDSQLEGFHPTQMAALKMFPTVLLAPPTPPLALLRDPPPPFFFQFFSSGDLMKIIWGASPPGSPSLWSICQPLEIINLPSEWDGCHQWCRVLMVLWRGI